MTREKRNRLARRSVRRGTNHFKGRGINPTETNNNPGSFLPGRRSLANSRQERHKRELLGGIPVDDERI